MEIANASTRIQSRSPLLIATEAALQHDGVQGLGAFGVGGGGQIIPVEDLEDCWHGWEARRVGSGENPKEEGGEGGGEDGVAALELRRYKGS